VTNAIEFKGVDILFPRDSGRASAARIRSALQHLDAGRSRTDILSSTGVVVGVSGAHLSVRTGEIAVLMGLSGSGKSTLLRAANGLNPVTRGQVRVAHEGSMVDVAACKPTTLRAVRRSSIAMVFQQFGLLPWRSVRDNVGLGLELRGEPPIARRQRVDEKLELVGLSQWADRPVAELSGGMQQRVGLARAFATDADILLMDEPFSALDPLIRTKLQEELVQLQEQLRKTILFVTHDLDEALRLGHSISVLEGGRIIQTGLPEDIVLRPASPYVAEFVQHMNPLSVLRGHMAMRRICDLPRSGSWITLDAGAHYRLVVTDRIVPIASTGNGSVELACVDAQTPLKDVIDLQHRTGHPVLLAEDGRISGVCTTEDVVRALAERHGAVKQAGDAN
jgi:glycine betaine/proline transport system ATP-binding protein